MPIDATEPLSSRRIEFRGSAGLTLVAESRGPEDAPPVVLLHGGGQTRYSWGGTASALAREGFHAVALDMRGHGESDWAPDGNYRLESFAADLRCVLEDFAKPAALVGASLGGLTTLLLAGEDPTFSGAAAVLVDVAPQLESAGAQRIADFMTAHPNGFASLEDAAEVVSAYTQFRMRGRNLRGLEKNLRRGEDGRYRWHWDPRFMSESGPVELTDPDRLYAAAGRMNLPTLLVRGRESDVLSEEGAARFLAAAPEAEYVDVSGAGHMVAGDQNDPFTQSVLTFLVDRARWQARKG